MTGGGGATGGTAPGGASKGGIFKTYINFKCSIENIDFLIQCFNNLWKTIYFKYFEIFIFIFKIWLCYMFKRNFNPFNSKIFHLKFWSAICIRRN